jgi:aspartate 1-decarboxylase
MFYRALKSKIHRATVTDIKIDYPGSVAIDEALLDKAGIKPYEVVLLANVTNGERVETYVVPADAGSGDFVVLGAAGRLFSVGDIVIVLNFSFYSPEEMEQLKPVVVTVDSKNRPD